VSEKPESAASGAEKRRSTRVLHSAAITVKGTDALGRPFRESTKTVMVNCYGCLYQAVRYPAPGSPIMLEVRQGNPRRAPRVVPGRVIWVQRPKGYRALYYVGVEFEVAGNVWDISLPPEDWFPSPEDEELVVPSSAEESITNPNQFVLQAPAAETTRVVPTSMPEVDSVFATSFADSRALRRLLLAEEKPVGTEAQANGPRSDADLREVVKMYTAEAIAQEIARIREFIQAELHNAINRAVQHSMGRTRQAAAEREASGQTELDVNAIAASEQDAIQRTTTRENTIESHAETIETNEPVAEATETSESLSSASFQGNMAEETPVVASDDPGHVRHLTARQRRAAKRARKMQKTTP
jgi:hypothetical protein